MGVSLSYRTSVPVPPDVVAAVLADVPRIQSADEWVLLEPIELSVDPEHGRLVGWSKLNGRLAPDELAGASSNANAFVAAFIGWSMRHGLVWEFSLVGEPIGQITDGVDTGGIRELLGVLASDAVETTDDPVK